MPDVAHDSDNRPPLLRRPEADALSDRIFVRPVAAGSGLIDDDDVRGRAVVMLGEAAAAEKRNPECREVVVRDDARMRSHRRRRRECGRSALDLEVESGIESAEGRGAGECHASDARHRLKPLEQRFVERDHPGVVAVPARG
jgi:hypothetical protein